MMMTSKKKASSYPRKETTPRTKMMGNQEQMQLLVGSCASVRSKAELKDWPHEHEDKGCSWTASQTPVRSMVAMMAGAR